MQLLLVLESELSLLQWVWVSVGAMESTNGSIVATSRLHNTLPLGFTISQTRRYASGSAMLIQVHVCMAPRWTISCTTCELTVALVGGN
mmetsp:Transcript_23181/g.36282  ORF Transcript_23181/g.36282 Transcript_23181/m.36282 type:complete len:89 (+) Transcript_23181:32-298(+)